MDTRDSFGRTIGGSRIVCPSCGGRGYIHPDTQDVETCEPCDVDGLLTLPLERWQWVALGEEGERDVYGPEDLTETAPELRAITMAEIVFGEVA